MGSLLDKSGRQVVVMAHGDTSYDDLGLERSQKTDSMDSSFSARSAQTPFLRGRKAPGWIGYPHLDDAGMPALASPAPLLSRAPPRARRHARLARCTASGESSSASVRVFKGGSAEVLFGAKQNLLGCIERGDDEGVELAVKELAGLNPTPAPARSEKLLGSWQLAWSRQASSSNPFQRAFAKWSTKNLQILSADGLENFIELGPMTVSARAPIRAVSDERTEVSISTIDIALFGNVVRRMEMTPKPGRGAGWVEQTFLDDEMRISVGNKGSVFVHVRERERDGDGDGAAESTSGGESTALARR